MIGAHYLGNNTCRFTFWSPRVSAVSVHLCTPIDRMIPMEAKEQGYWQVTIEGVPPGSTYFYHMDLGEGLHDRTDPASHYQPEGVHGCSMVIDHHFSWTDGAWQGIPLDEMVIYELHVGTFTPEGTFAAIIPRLSNLKELGITAIEVMPVAQFPGTRNWGYDGVYPFAVQNSYGGVEGLKALVDACHREGLAILLDVVYNHLGPEGNYLWGLGTYFTDRYHTPWGDAVNFDGAYSDGVRQYFIENALYWLREFHFDGLRLDAIHAIYDCSALHILAEMSERVHAFSLSQGRTYSLIAESDLNDVRVIDSRDRRGFGMDSQWSDDFHHALHTLFTKETGGFYQDFGKLTDLQKAIACGFVYDGCYSNYRKRCHGNVSGEFLAHQFVIATQNHDQVGNRMLGERLCHLIPFPAWKLAAAALLLTPGIPLIFMGEEYGDPSPFLYFVSHSDPSLIEGVRQGRRREFAAFQEKGTPPDPQAESTFQRSILQWQAQHNGHHAHLRQFYQKLLQLRKSYGALQNYDRSSVEVKVEEEQKILLIHRTKDRQQISIVLNFSDREHPTAMVGDCILDSETQTWGGQRPEPHPSTVAAYGVLVFIVE